MTAPFTPSDLYRTSYPLMNEWGTEAAVGDGAMYDPAVLDITEEDLKKKFQAGVSNVAALSLAAGYPTAASVPHSFINGYKNLLAVTLEVDYVFPLAEKIKAILSDPEAFAAMVAASAAAAAA